MKLRKQGVYISHKATPKDHYLLKTQLLEPYVQFHFPPTVLYKYHTPPPQPYAHAHTHPSSAGGGKISYPTEPALEGGK